jgi:hypothetical protein
MICFKPKQIASDAAHAAKIMARAHNRSAAGVRNMARKVFMVAPKVCKSPYRWRHQRQVT